MTIRRLGPCGRELWLETARACPYATYFHTPAWAELMAEVRPWLEVAAEQFALDDGTVAVLPLLVSRSCRVFRGYESMAPGVYGGPIADRPLSAPEVNAILDLAVSPTTAALRVFGNPFLEAFAASPEAADEFTHVVDLREGFDAAFRRFHRNHRRSFLVAQASGVVVDRASTLEDFRAYYEVYRVDRQRWGERALSNHPFRLFVEIQRRADPNVVLWLAKLDGRVIAGDLWLYWNTHNVGWHGAADPEFFAARPTNFLLTEIIRDACWRGARWCDLNPSAGLAGVIAFKDAFGAERRYFRHARRGGGGVYNVARRIERAVQIRLRRALRW